MIKNTIILHIILGMSILSSCTSNPYEVDVSNINADFQLVRFEDELFACESVEDVLAIKAKYPFVYDMYTQNIMLGKVTGMNSTPTDIASELYQFVNHHDMDSLYQMTKAKFNDFGAQSKDIKDLIKHIKYYYPDEEIDEVVTFISAMNYGTDYIPSKNMFAIGLDLYMGRNFEVYYALDFPYYRIKKFDDKYLTSNMADRFAEYVAIPSEKTSFIEDVIYDGKKLYCLDLLLPEAPDSIKIGYFKGQIEWNEANEANIWAYFIENDLIFSSDRNSYYLNFLNDGPFTTPFGNESSPRIGAWLGWQIVRDYMAKNPDVSLQQLMAMTDHKEIFNKSGYKP